jgi:two-component system sensor histidine kinase/response regulator
VLIKPVNASLLLDSVMRSFGKTLDGAPVSARRNAVTEHIDFGGARILLAEDNELNQEVAVALLEDAGCRVTVANDGAEALAAVGEDGFDLVLMDMQMPVMDGLASTRAIRELPGKQSLPIIAMTANAMAADREACIAAGMNDHVPKPIEPEELWCAMRKWLHATTAQTSVDTTDGPQVPNDIPGLDTVQGMRRVLGKPALYLSMLRKFCAGQASAIEACRTALQASDGETVLRTMHTLKGVAGNIGAEEVQKEAAKMEAAIKHGAMLAELNFAELEKKLNALIAALTQHFPGDEKVVPVEVDPARVNSVGVELLALLHASSSKAGRMFEENRSLFAAAFPEHLQALADAIDDFDFDSAEQQLHSALDAYQNNNGD